MREYIKIPLPEAEYAALARLAEKELRPLQMQAHYLLRLGMQVASTQSDQSEIYEQLQRRESVAHA